MTLRWYVLHSKSRKENPILKRLEIHHVEGYFPCIHVPAHKPDNRKITPYFPGYLFVRVDLDQTNHSILKWMPGAIGLVSFGGEPASVPDESIQAIQRRVEEKNDMGGKVYDDFHSGDQVYIQESSFAGYDAIFDTRSTFSRRIRIHRQCY